MKKIIFLLFLFLFVFNTVTIHAQQVPRKLVVLEIGTGTWCGYCPGAAMGADDLVMNGHKVAVVENHNGDSFANTGSNARNSYYSISGFPTAVFDGGDRLVGGSHTNSLYGAYVPLYNAAMEQMSDFTVAISFTRDGQDITATVDVDEVGDYAGENLVVHLILTESEIAYNWQGQTHLDYVNRAMYPNQNGTPYSGGSDSIDYSFTANSNWDMEHGELVAFIQDNDTKKILQADRVFLKTPPAVENSVALLQSLEIPDVCFGGVSPQFLVKNVGANDITSMDIDYTINDGATTGTYAWSGIIAFNEYDRVTMENIGFDLLSNNTIEYTITHINSADDPDDSDNSGNGSFDESPETSNNIVHLELHTDNYGSECTWKMMDFHGNVIANGGPYGNNQTIYEDIDLEDPDCYYFQIIDQYGDGGGMINLTDDAGQVLYHSNGAYGAGYTQAFKTPNAGLDVSEAVFAHTEIYPNPVQTELKISNAMGMDMQIVDMLGREFMHKKVQQPTQVFDVSALQKGTYLLRLRALTKTKTFKIIISNH